MAMTGKEAQSGGSQQVSCPFHLCQELLALLKELFLYFKIFLTWQRSELGKAETISSFDVDVEHEAQSNYLGNTICG